MSKGINKEDERIRAITIALQFLLKLSNEYDNFENFDEALDDIKHAWEEATEEEIKNANEQVIKSDLTIWEPLLDEVMQKSKIKLDKMERWQAMKHAEVMYLIWRWRRPLG